MDKRLPPPALSPCPHCGGCHVGSGASLSDGTCPSPWHPCFWERIPRCSRTRGPSGAPADPRTPRLAVTAWKRLTEGLVGWGYRQDPVPAGKMQDGRCHRGERGRSTLFLIQPRGASGYTRDRGRAWQPGICSERETYLSAHPFCARDCFLPCTCVTFFLKKFQALLSVHSRKLRTFVHAKICTQMFKEVCLTIAKTWRQRKRPSQDEWINKCGPSTPGNMIQPQKGRKH